MMMQDPTAVLVILGRRVIMEYYSDRAKHKLR